MKFLSEYRNPEVARRYLDEIHKTVTRPWTIMEVCGGQTHSLVKNGILEMLPEEVQMVHGPGCPVCVTSQQDIDAFIALAMEENVILATFGDLVRVPGTDSSLQEQKAAGRDVRIVYSASDAVELAKANPDREVVFCGVGFETTTPTMAATILAAEQMGLANFSIYSAHKTTPPALAALMETRGVNIDGFLLPGHVSVITGTEAYRPVFEAYDIPSVIAGFEPVDILKALLMLVEQNETGKIALENAYQRAVAPGGNPRALQIMDQVFERNDAVWRGIGMIPDSGMTLRPAFDRFNAAKKITISVPEAPEPKGCACGEILMGKKTPEQCGLYRKTCTPAHPVGPCMVSSEGACAAYYRYS